MFGRRLHSARPDRQALVTVGRVAHPLSIGAEIATFCFERLGRLLGGCTTTRQQAEQGVWTLLPDHILGVGDPRRGLRGSSTVHRVADHPYMLATVKPIQDLDTLAAEGAGNMLPDPLGSIADDHHPPQDGLLTATVGVQTAPADDVQRPTPRGFRSRDGAQSWRLSRAPQRSWGQPVGRPARRRPGPT